MTSIPENLAKIAPILDKYLISLLIWLSSLVYERLIPSNSDHLLVAIDKLVDFSILEEVCANYHKLNGNGRPVEHTVRKLVRSMLVKYLYNLSLRELEGKIQYDIPAKWFAGYPIFANAPDHSTLSRFESYLIFNHPRLFFDTILEMIDSAFPDDQHRPQIGDTFAMHANAALESLIKRLRHGAQELLLAYQKTDPDAYEKLYASIDVEALFGKNDEKTECYLSTEQRRERLFHTVAAVLDCLVFTKTADLPLVQQWVTWLEKILTDELHLEWDEDGTLVDIAYLPKKKRGTYRICSATDPDATIRNHGPGKIDFGYNISVAATINFIREIQADTGSRPDAAPISELLASQIEHHDVCPDKFIYDQAAGYGKTVSQVDEATNGQTKLVAKPMPGKRKKGRFSPDDFTLSDDGLSLTCPDGRISYRKYKSGSGDGHTFRFIAPQCQLCPLLKQCRGSDNKPTTKKDVFIGSYRPEWNQLQEYSKTDEFKLDMSLRPQIERVISGLVLHNGARCARFRGSVKVDFQAKMNATAYNLKRWVSLLEDKPIKKRRRFNAPPPQQPALELPKRDLSLPKGEVGLLTA